MKPIFVFDGKMPQIKRNTLAKRRKRDGINNEKSASAISKILRNHLKRELISSQLRYLISYEDKLEVKSLNMFCLLEKL